MVGGLRYCVASTKKNKKQKQKKRGRRKLYMYGGGDRSCHALSCSSLRMGASSLVIIHDRQL